MAKHRKHRKGTVHKTSTPKIQPVWLAIIAVAAIGGILLLIVSLVKGSGGGTDPNFKAEVAGAPRIAVEQDRIDHGNVKLGTTIESDFKIRNVGDKDLVILGEPRVEVVEGC
jgi:hypothetical protein